MVSNPSKQTGPPDAAGMQAADLRLCNREGQVETRETRGSSESRAPSEFRKQFFNNTPFCTSKHSKTSPLRSKYGQC